MREGVAAQLCRWRFQAKIKIILSTNRKISWYY
jgi:hypothetical protein